MSSRHECETRGGSQNLLHNMSVPPKTTIKIAPGRQAAAFEVALGTETWDELRELGPRRSMVIRLATVMRPHARFTAQKAARFLEWQTDWALNQAKSPAAAVLLPGYPIRWTAELELRLVLAILSRCSGRMFLRARTPRYDETTLSRVALFARGSQPWRLT